MLIGSFMCKKRLLPQLCLIFHVHVQQLSFLLLFLCVFVQRTVLSSKDSMTWKEMIFDFASMLYDFAWKFEHKRNRTY